MDGNKIVGKKSDLAKYARHLYNKITKIPKEVRGDTKTRTGLAALVREVNSRNLVFLKVYEPSDAAMFFVSEKATRSELLQHSTSQESENEDSLWFTGSITVTLETGIKIQGSTSGLLSHEDVAVSIALLAMSLEWTPRRVIENVRQNKGKFPAFVDDPDHYLQSILKI